LYGRTGKFDVIAITDHILMKKDILARAGRLATLGRRAFGVRERDFDAYLEDIQAQADRAWNEYGMLVTEALGLLTTVAEGWEGVVRALKRPEPPANPWAQAIPPEAARSAQSHAWSL
jgi:hypothetical protein